MENALLGKIKNNLLLISLILISTIVCLRNYSPGTYLSGWDTLHPEFDFSLNFSRVLFGVFRNEQGLGAVAGHSHMSDLPRIVELYLLHFIFSKDLLRYISILSALIIGPLGTYFFILKFTKDKLISFLGGIFYLLNLGTLQQFVVPFEMFATQYAFLPWLFLSIVNFLKENTKKNLLIFLAITFLASPMAYAATLWYAYFLSLFIFLFTYYLSNKNKEIFKRSVQILIFTLAINSYWILPNIYFVLNHATEVANSKINILFTEEAFAQNVAFGKINDIVLFKGFLFNWGIYYYGDSKFGQLLDVWQKHLDNPYATMLGFSFFAIILAGIAWAAKKSKDSIPILSIFLLSFLFLSNVNPPIGFIFKFAQDHIPFFSEALRFPFTKFSMLFIFSSSIFFAYGVNCLTKILRKVKYSQVIVSIILVFALIYYMWPAFYGNMVSPFMRIKIPNEYFQMFDWFKKEPQGRIAYLPIQSFWGWDYYKWYDKNPSYQGSGFIWFGIKQPILYRDFDRWNPSNEEYYREMSQAVYTNNLNLLRNLLVKYDISYILLDKNVIAPDANPKVLFLNEIESELNQLGIKPTVHFGKNIIVYKISSDKSVYTIKNEKNVSPKLSAGYEDFAFDEYGPYITSKTPSVNGTLFPLRNLIDNQNKISNNLIKLTQEGVLIDLKNTQLSQLSLPTFENLEASFAVDLVVVKQNNTLKITFRPKFPKSLVPLETTANLPPGQNNFLLSIDQKENFILNNLSENTPLSLGKIFLKLNDKNSISIYQDKDDATATPNFSVIRFSLNSCDNRNSGILGFDPNFNNFTLSAKDANPCLEIPLNNIFSQNELGNSSEFLLGVSFKNKNLDNSSFCLSRNDACVNYELTNVYSKPFSTDRSFYYFGVQSQNFSDSNLRFSFNNPTSKMQKITYSDVQLSLKKPFYHLDFSKDVLSLSLDTLRNSKDKNFLIPFSGNPQFSRDITNELRTGDDCQTSPGLISQPKKEIIKQTFKSYIRYLANDGSFCDHFSYRNLTPGQAYLIVVQSRNIEGLPIRFCVSNPNTKRCDIYSHLSSSPTFTNDIFLLPPMQNLGTDSPTGFDININNFAIKGIPAINDIASINIIPFPYNWLSRIESDPSVNQPVEKTVSAIELNDSQYIANLRPGDANKILALSESFENGWHAYEIKNSKFPIINWFRDNFPFLFGTELKSHVLVNNWANGWNGSSEGSSRTIAIIFFPQYLEYFGFLILFLIPISIFRLKI